MGDGNIHYDVLRPDGGSDAEHSGRRDQGSRIVHDIVASMGGSISAEHGLGSMKTNEALRYKSPVRGRGAAGHPQGARPQADHEPAGAVLRLGLTPKSDQGSRMLIVLSPAKALDFTAGPPAAPLTAPQLADQTAELSKTVKKLRAIDLKRMMSLSNNLAKLNRERFPGLHADSEDGLQAAFAFNGDVYAGLKARELDRKALGWEQDHVRILSGLYGVLRPLDAIQPYRLEMGVRIKTRRGASLYDFWGPCIAQTLDAALAGHKERTW